MVNIKLMKIFMRDAKDLVVLDSQGETARTPNTYKRKLRAHVNEHRKLYTDYSRQHVSL